MNAEFIVHRIYACSIYEKILHWRVGHMDENNTDKIRRSWVRAPQIYSNIYPTRCNFTQFIYIWKLLYMFRVLLPSIIRSAYSYIYSIWYLSHRYCYLPLSWRSWNWFDCAVGGHPQHTQTSSNTFTIAAGSSNGLTNTRCCR